MSLLQAGFGSSGDDYEITDSLRLRSSASAYLARTNLQVMVTETFTFSGWASILGVGAQTLFGFHAGISSAGGWGGDAINFRMILMKLNVALYRCLITLYYY